MKYLTACILATLLIQPVYAQETKIISTQESIEDAIEKEYSDLIVLKSNIQNLHTSVGNDYNHVRPSVLLISNVVPISMINLNNHNTLTNGFGGTVDVKSTIYNTTNKDKHNAFNITYKEVPGSICYRLVGLAMDDFDKIVVGKMVIKDQGVNLHELDNKKLVDACKKEGSIIFTSM